jgi:GT2 family glycosyltransferase
MPPARTRTSFVIASRNRAPELAEVVNRLLDTTDCPVIVVDNGSEDDTAARIRGVASRSGGRVQLVELAENLGAVGRNVGVERAATPFVAFCDDDSWWEPQAPDRAEDVFDRYPTVALLAARTIVYPDRREDDFCRLLADSALGRRADLPGPSILGFMSCAAIVRRSAFQAAGGFSDILHFRGEEQLLAVDLASLGWDLCYCPELVAIHQPSASRGSTAAQDARVLRNRVLTAWLRRPLPQCLRATSQLLRAAVRDREHARAAGEALWRLPAALGQRRSLPAQVESAVRQLETH